MFRAFKVASGLDLIIPFAAHAAGSADAETVKHLGESKHTLVQGIKQAEQVDLVRQREIVTAFLAASQSGDFSPLLAILDPDVVLRADASAVEASARANVPGSPPRSAVATPLRTSSEAARGRRSSPWWTGIPP
jgi:RNA polymerase sigma-70 factor (ECF subfamily)